MLVHKVCSTAYEVKKSTAGIDFPYCQKCNAWLKADEIIEDTVSGV